MSEDFFQIDKKEILSKFKDLVNKHAEREDDYNPEHSRSTNNPTGYFILDRIRSLYHWIIEQIKIDLRRKYIDNDDKYKKIFGELENYARNKIRAESDGTMYLRVNSQLTFSGDKKQYREELKDKPSELKRYEKKLKKATFYANKGEGFRRKGNKQAVTANSAKCESLCEDALEILQEIVDADASLQIWFDRALNFGFGSHIDAQLGNLPRIVTSRSIDKQSGDSRIRTKKQVKIDIVEQAIDALKYESKIAADADKAATNSKLADFLNNL